MRLKSVRLDNVAMASRQYLDAKIKTWVEYLRGSLPELLAAHQAELAAYELSGSLGGVRVAN
ncbi:hypothetical protein ASD91_11160 [Pseudomonas sp. Root68]|nr:hypothetical protein ASD91_11160 [Pseudomonas sp. Root68]KRB65880.1 hypothetical protein ASD95_10465 [Pseudomonas sp. Root71]